MNSEFVICSKCGTRNFSDDEICGVCKTKLSSQKRLVEAPSNNATPQKTNYFFILLIAGAIAFLYYNVLHKDKPKASNETPLPSTNYYVASPAYSLIKTNLNNKRAFNVAVRISEKLSDQMLKSLAQQVKSDIHAVAQTGIVFFLLPEMEDNNGAWAAVDFTPEIKVRILGQSLEDEIKVKSGLGKISDYYGLWLDNKAQGDVILRIRVDKVEGYVIEYISPSDTKPSEFAVPLKKEKRKGKTIFKDTEHPEQYYVLENNGDLSVFDNYGFVESYKRLK